MFELHVKAEYGSAYAKVGMKYIEELDYPLMYIEEDRKSEFYSLKCSQGFNRSTPISFQIWWKQCNSSNSSC